MPEQLDEQAAKTVRRLLHDNWDPTNTLQYDPTLDPSNTSDALPLHFGNYSSDLPDPQVSVAQPQGEFTVGGRWSGKNSSTGGMNQYRRGLILVQCWATTGDDYNGENARDIIELLRHEVERVIGQFTDGPAPGETNDHIWSFSTSWEGRFPDPDAETSPTWQSQVMVTYDWERNVG